MAEKVKPRIGDRRKPFAKRSLGQNFLIDKSVVNGIVSSLSLSPDDAVIEIGPGRGALTGELVKSGANVGAIELDHDLADALARTYRDRPGFHLFEADVLDTDLRVVASSICESPRVKLAGNLPYNISTPILRKLFESRDLFSVITVMLQKEVAERIVAAPGSSERGFITVLVERGFTSELLFSVPPGAFRPIPKVTSAVVRLTPRVLNVEHTFGDEQFEALVSAAFSQKRKTLKNNLSSAPASINAALKARGGAVEVISRAGIEEKARAESLSLKEWTALAEEIFRAS